MNRQSILMGCFMMALVFCLVVAAAAAPPSVTWPYSHKETSALISTFIDNLHYSETDAIVASRSKANPDYWYDWARDSALSMSTALRYYQSMQLTDEMEALWARYDRWNERALRQDGTPGQDIRSEPKFYVDGTVFSGGWCRGQNDGPALRSKVRTSRIDYYLAYGKIEEARKLWGDNGKCCGAKYDLEHAAHNHRAPSCEVWEEVRGLSFWNMLASRASLIQGATVAFLVDEYPDAGFYYLQQAREVTRYTYDNYFRPEKGVILPTIDYHPDDTIAKAKMDIDSAVFLTSLYNEIKHDDLLLLLNATSTRYSQECPSGPLGTTRTGAVSCAEFEALRNYVSLNVDNNSLEERDNLASFKPWGNEILMSWDKLARWSMENYTVNQQSARQGAYEQLIARYPNDVYDGTGTSRGNPWLLATSSSAELFYRLSKHMAKADSWTIHWYSKDFWLATTEYLADDIKSRIVPILQSLDQHTRPDVKIATEYTRAFSTAALARGDWHMHHVYTFAPPVPPYNIPEEIHRETGQHAGASYLTWSYATFIGAYLERHSP